jgi:hypothetical protein
MCLRLATVLDPPVGRRDPAEDGKIDSERLGVGAAEPVRSSGDSRYIFTANPAGPTSSI